VAGNRRRLSPCSYPGAGLAKVRAELLVPMQKCIDAPHKRGSPGAAAQVNRTLRGRVNFAIRRGCITAADPLRRVDIDQDLRVQA